MDRAIEISVRFGAVRDIDGFGDFGALGCAVLFDGEVGEDVAFDDEEATDFPADVGHFFDDSELADGLGPEFGDVLLDEKAEAVFGFAFEEGAFDKAIDAGSFEFAAVFAGDGLPYRF